MTMMVLIGASEPITNLQRVQNRAARTITKTSKRQHCPPDPETTALASRTCVGSRIVYKILLQT